MPSSSQVFNGTDLIADIISTLQNGSHIGYRSDNGTQNSISEPETPIGVSDGAKAGIIVGFIVGFYVLIGCVMAFCITIHEHKSKKSLPKNEETAGDFEAQEENEEKYGKGNREGNQQ